MPEFRDKFPRYSIQSTIGPMFRMQGSRTNGRNLQAVDTAMRHGTVTPNTDGRDDAERIQAAFTYCGHNSADKRGEILFLNKTYTIKSVMNTTHLSNVDIYLKGTLSWDNTNISYWLNNSLPVGLQNQSSAWLLGGTGLTFSGNGYGTFNGNGQAWYDYNDGHSNLKGRPHQITVGNMTNSHFSGLRFINSQMWTMTVINSDSVLLEDVYVNTTSHGASADNTDGLDIAYSNNITIRRWEVINGDDSLSCKDNSTNIIFEDCILRKGNGVAIGSIGQYEGQFSTIQNVTARNITSIGTKYAAYIKTWTGERHGYPPNGGGGGLGFASNISFQGTINTRSVPFLFTQCTNYGGGKGNCDSSMFNVRNIVIKDVTGTVNSSNVAELQCSAASPCTNISFGGINLVNSTKGTKPSGYLCHSVETPVGFRCTGNITTTNNGS
ncbi:glycoside hydrolase family 28 protein [Myriangium duriaei CBS 260.36]|uniref:Glycoside hydrolase family 28 protein n=1 Tax=Myriangium duriaei CBS 260.36 TaxID=1168546 RepID=A0A9P4J0A0_9PEZI|nr:glycoside hydrolase family 28 protein [Myriangium duriaei CBS 260.36]